MARRKRGSIMTGQHPSKWRHFEAEIILPRFSGLEKRALLVYTWNILILLI
jgi:hypothetical protein